jgi:hypothetical protein
MAMRAWRRAAAALLIVCIVIGLGATRALAQESSGSTITTGGITTDAASDVLVPAPGVTISSGDVTNETGIGVVIGGGTSAGAAPGGGTSSSVVE